MGILLEILINIIVITTISSSEAPIKEKIKRKLKIWA